MSYWGTLFSDVLTLYVLMVYVLDATSLALGSECLFKTGGEFGRKL